MKPSVGRIVITKGIRTSNGTDEHPAIVTRVWSDKEPSEAAVLCNLTVFPDCGTVTAISQGSVQIFDDRAAAEAHLQTQPGPVCFWPDRV